VKIYRAYWLLVLIFLVGCAASDVKLPPSEDREKIGNSPKAQSYTDTKINEDFDPLILRDDKIDAAKLKAESRSVVEERDKIRVNSVSEHLVLSEDVSRSRADSIRNAVSGEMVPGWRIQVCALASETKAREILLQAEDVFETFENLKVYFTYDSPYYKVRLGDCTSRYQADRLLQIAMENNFIDAWVVKTNVYKLEDLFHQSEYPIETLQDSTESPKFLK
jgi:hypothetical protein